MLYQHPYNYKKTGHNDSKSSFIHYYTLAKYKYLFMVHVVTFGLKTISRKSLLKIIRSIKVFV